MQTKTAVEKAPPADRTPEAELRVALSVERARRALDFIRQGRKLHGATPQGSRPSETMDPQYVTMCEELFGPVLTLYVYDENKFEDALKLVDNTSSYALTGAIIAQDRYAVELATQQLRYSAGNFYINDKPTGAVVGQQPFGGARASGTNDKAGAMQNLMRWVSTRTIKETFTPPSDYRYPFMEAE